MKLLGALGLDWKILIIQSVNFLILFFILKKLFFKPFIQSIKEEQLKKEQISRKQNQLKLEQEKWQKEREEEIIKTRNKIDKMLAEAEEIIKRNRNKFKIGEIEEEKEALKRIQEQSKNIVQQYKEEISQRYKKEIIYSLLNLFSQELSSESKKIIQQNFWRQFIKSIEKTDFEIVLLKNSLPKLFSNYPPDRSQKYIKNPLPKLFSSYPLTRSQKHIITRIINNKLPQAKINLHYQIDQSIIAGFRLEIGGILVEESLRQKIEKIFIN